MAATSDSREPTGAIISKSETFIVGQNYTLSAEKLVTGAPKSAKILKKEAFAGRIYYFCRAETIKNRKDKIA
jgi:hypothetical protein